jgi:hypothetical protein
MRSVDTSQAIRGRGMWVVVGKVYGSVNPLSIVEEAASNG